MRKLTKKEKIIISIASSFLGVIAVFAFLFGFDVFNLKPGNFLYYKVDGGYEIVGINENVTELVIPSSYKGLPVVGIGDAAFYDESRFKDVTSVKLPNSLKYIGNNAFRGLWSLKSIVIPSSVVSIGDNAFLDCVLLNSIEFSNDNSIQSIGRTAFNNTKIKDSTVEVLGEFGESYFVLDDIALFSENIGTQVVIPDNIRVLAADIFYSNYNVKSVSVGADSCLQFISSFGFALTNITSIDFSQCSSLLGISSYAFQYCSLLQSVILPDSLK